MGDPFAAFLAQPDRAAILTDFDGTCRGRLRGRRLKEGVLASAKRFAGNALYEKLRAAVLGPGRS